MNKTVYILFITVVLFLSGCSSGIDESSDTITVWHWMGDRQETFDKLAAKYEVQTGQRVQFELYAPSEAYSQKIKAAAQTRTLPDIFGILGDTKDFASFVKSGFVLEINQNSSKTESPWRKILYSKALDVNEFRPGNTYNAPPGLYGVPLDMTNVQLLYNKRLFREAGLDPNHPPKTWREFIETARTLRQAGIPVLVGGFGEIWMIDIMATSFAMNIMGENKVYDTYRGNIPYTDPDWLKVLGLFKEMTDEDVFVSGTVTMVNKTAEQTFANEKAAFAWNGSWCVNVYEGMNPDLEYAAVLPPRVSNLHSVRIWGGAGNSLMVNEKSRHREEALQFLTWMAQEDQQFFFARETNNLPANRNASRRLPTILAQFADDLDNTFHLNTMPVNEYPRVMEAWSKGIQSIMIGEKTPAQVAQEVQDVKDRELIRKKRT